jgi:pyruvate,water dikinase
LNILWLGDPDCHDPSLVGGKAANLSRVATAHPVPPGFCLTTSAFDQATGGGEMTGAAMAVPSSVTPLLYAQLTSAYQLLAELCHLPEPSVAVRSSAVGEDSSTASFAGQHDTYLNVKGVEAVAQAVVGCWQSVSSSLAEEYRRQQGLSQDPPRIAVLVQRLVSADLSAVVFSANPVTGNSNEVVINANWGLGESVVGGTVTPDTYVISKVDFTVTSQDISQKDRMTVLVPGGTQEADVPLALQNLASADQNQALEMARLAVELERTMGWPVDVEWAYEDGRLYLLQCRPITTL